MKTLLLTNTQSGEQKTYQVNYDFNINNKQIADAILKSASSVYKTNFDKLQYI
jgi:hypothetical protein